MRLIIRDNCTSAVGSSRSRRRAKAWLAVGVVLMLAACATPPPPPPPAPPPPPPPPRAQFPVLPEVGTIEPNPEDAAVIASLPARPKFKPQPPAPPSAGAFNPDSLIGLNQDEILILLGNATSVRQESPARVWKYHSEGCDFELFFYLDLATDSFHALAYDILINEGVALSREECINRIRAEYVDRTS